MKYTQEKIEEIAKRLRALPPVDKKKIEHSRLETVRMLRGEISAMQKRGYSLDQIAETLRGEGLDIVTPTLKSYLQRVKKSGESKTKKDKQATANSLASESMKKTRISGASKASFEMRPDTSDI